MNFREKDDLKEIPSKFSRLPDTYYYQMGDQPVVKVGNMKNLIESFPSHHEELGDFVKLEKISAKNGEELLKLFKYYNSISGVQ